MKCDEVFSELLPHFGRSLDEQLRMSKESLIVDIVNYGGEISKR